jgi:hypothetical protein
MLMRVRGDSATVRGVCLALALVASARPTAQPPAAPQPGTPIFRSGVDLVELDLRVVDARGGAAISDLTAADLEVRENGVAQRIEDQERSANAPAIASAWRRSTSSPPTSVKGSRC